MAGTSLPNNPALPGLLGLVLALSPLNAMSSADSPPSPTGERSGLLPQPLAQKTPSGAAYKLFSDVPYAPGEGRQRLDVYIPDKPPAAKGKPAVLIIHGGGWSKGDKAKGREINFASFMVEQDYVAVSINYTLAPPPGDTSNPGKKGAWPQNIYDCKSALRWMKKNAEVLGIDPGRIAVMGGSAGGHLALLTGLSAQSAELNQGGHHTEQDNSVRCIIDFYGVPDVRRWGGNFFIDEKPMEKYPEIWALASPVTHLAADSPPIMVVHGTADPLVKIELSDEFVEILKAKGVTHEYIVIKDAVHMFALNPPQMDLAPAVGAFLKKHL
jgi:acetyl esterase/lipase